MSYVPCRVPTNMAPTRAMADFLDSSYIYQENENFQDMDNVSSQPLFVLDCAGDSKLKSKFEEKHESENESEVKTSSVVSPKKSQHKKEKSKEKRVKEELKKKYSNYCLSSSINPHLDKLIQKSKTGVNTIQKTIKPAADPTSEIISQRQKKKMNKQRRDKVCSDKWFNMKAPEMTRDIKNQLTVLQIREILDRKNFYKNNDRKRFPKFFQMGKVVESAADFYHARIPKKQRKSTLLEEVMADADMKKYQKRKYAEIFGDAKKAKNKKKRKPVST